MNMGEAFKTFVLNNLALMVTIENALQNWHTDSVSKLNQIKYKQGPPGDLLLHSDHKQ